jgi:hypothetical protein
MSLSVTQKYNLHAVVVSLLILIPIVVPITPLMEYAEKASFFLSEGLVMLSFI